MRTGIKWTEIKRTGIMWTGITNTGIARKMMLVLAGAVLLAGCDDHDTILVPVSGSLPPAPPVGLEAGYYNRAVTLYWNLAAGWDGETFLVFGKRVEDNSFFLIADVTSCSEGSCEYTDTNIVAAVTYDYYVAALDSRTGLETDSDRTVRVAVPTFAPPPVPTDLEVVALDATNYIRWNDDARAAGDFSAYRVYLLADGGETPTLLGESDSPGFLDALAENGVTSSYAVSSVDVHGHESGTSFSAKGTPRPDFTGELIYAFMDDPAVSGKRGSSSGEDRRARASRAPHRQP